MVKKSILILYDFLKEIGGLERVLFFKANALSKKFNVLLGFSYLNKEAEKEIREMFGLKDNIKIIPLGKNKSEVVELTKSFLFPSRLKIKPDLIISHSFMSSIMAAKAKKRRATKYIVFLHHPPNFLYKSVKMKDWINSIPRFFASLLGLFLKSNLKKRDINAVKRADLVFVNSKYTKKRIEEIYGVNSIVIYPPVSREFKPTKIKKNKSGKFILMHGRIIPDKKPEYGIMALAKSSLKDIKLVISGSIDKKLKEKLKTLAVNLGVENRVDFLGKVSQKRLVELYNEAEAFIVTAPKEDFGLTPIEAMACGTPVVAWNDGAGPSETVTDGLNGYLAKPYNPEDMARLIDKIINEGFKNKNRKRIARSVGQFSEKESGKKLSKKIIELTGW